MIHILLWLEIDGQIYQRTTHTAVTNHDHAVCDDFVYNQIILINLFPWMGKVEQPIEVQTNLVFFSNIGYTGYKFSTPVIKSAAKCELLILSIQFDMKTAARVQLP